MQIFQELQRRNVVRVTFGYIVSCWLLIQVADLVLENIGAPDWVIQTIMLVLALGFPVVVFFSWAYEVTPEGIKRESEVDRSQSITHVTGRKLDRAITAVLLVALAYFAFDKFVVSSARESDLVEATTKALVEKFATKHQQSAESGKSVAVLPFVNMSEDAGNEYFADGLSEELLNMLVKIPELRVAARTSSFSFKDKDLKISEIAHALNVSHILEGSVRKSGNKVRITAQLINADDGFHLWSETFDRTLDDIFVVQDEIAANVAQALEVTLMGKTQAERMIDPEAYRLYLKGLHFLLQGGAENYRKSEDALLQAVELEDDYAKAWSTLAMNYYHQIRFRLKTREDGYALAKNAIGRAKSLDPDFGGSWGVDGFLKKNLDWDWAGAQTAINKAYEVDPKYGPVMIWRASMAATLGKLDDALRLYEQRLLDDPLSLSSHSSLGLAYTKVHRYSEAIEIFEKQAELSPDYHWAYFNLGKAHLFRGDAERALMEIKKNPENVYRNTGLVMAYSTLGREVEAEEALNRLVSEYGLKNPGWVAEAYSWRGQKDEAFQWLETAFVQKDNTLAYLLGNNVFYALRDDPRWMDLLEKLHLMEYWQAMPEEYGGPRASSSQ